MQLIKGSENLKKALKKYAKKVKPVKVGFLEGATYDDGTLVAEVAFWNEFGTEDEKGREENKNKKDEDKKYHIEPRLFFRNTIKEKECGQELGKDLPKADVKTALGRAGKRAVADIQRTIVEFSTPKNTKLTIKLKGFDAPLKNTNARKRH